MSVYPCSVHTNVLVASTTINLPYCHRHRAPCLELSNMTSTKHHSRPDAFVTRNTVSWTWKAPPPVTYRHNTMTLTFKHDNSTTRAPMTFRHNYYRALNYMTYMTRPLFPATPCSELPTTTSTSIHALFCHQHYRALNYLTWQAPPPMQLSQAILCPKLSDITSTTHASIHTFSPNFQAPLCHKWKMARAAMHLQ
jgi:hypothetical protein